MTTPTSYIGMPPGRFVIPVTLGADRQITLNRKDTAGHPVNWNVDGLWIVIDIDKTNPTTIDANIIDTQATIRLESLVCDQVKNTTRWRLIMSTGTTPTLETAIATGTFERHDG